MFATATTSAMWLRILAWFAVDSPPTLTIYALLKAEHSAARSATNLPCPCAVDIIARCIVMGTKLRGGRKLGLIRAFPLARCGSRRVPSQIV